MYSLDVKWGFFQVESGTMYNHKNIIIMKKFLDIGCKLKYKQYQLVGKLGELYNKCLSIATQYIFWICCKKKIHAYTCSMKKVIYKTRITVF